MTDTNLDKLVDLIKTHLTEKLGRAPTEKELVDKLPLILCKNIDG